MPAETIAETASPAASVDVNAARCVVTASGLRRMRSVISVAIPSVPSEPMNAPSRSGPSGIERLAAELDDLAVGEHDGQAGDVVDREAVLEAVGAARVLGHVAADRADLLARGVGRVEEAVRRDGARHVEVRDPRLDHDPLRREIDLEDAVHPRERDDDPIGDREGAAGEAGAGAARDERDALAGADADDRPHLGGRAGEDDELGRGAPAREPVAVVDAELLGLRDHVVGRRRRR